jgi:hypothetical protein
VISSYLPLLSQNIVSIVSTGRVLTRLFKKIKTMLKKNLIPLVTGIAIITSPLVALAQFPQPQSAPPPQQQQSPVAGNQETEQ